jgi:hypothetical protein
MKGQTMKECRTSRLLGAVAVAVTLTANVALAANPNPRILPPDSTPYGQTYGQWGDAWWQWAFSFPTDTNPMLDPTGAMAANGQGGPVWFLAGTGGGEVTRTVTVPAGKALFFPNYNSLWINVPLLGDNPWSADQEAFARQYLATTYVDNYGPGDLTCEIDGRTVVEILSYRCSTPPGGAFMVSIPEKDLWGLVGLPTIDGGTFEPGIYGPSVQDGIYLMLAPLPAGQHTIHFTAKDFLDVTYNLTVLKPPPVKAAPVSSTD